MAHLNYYVDLCADVFIVNGEAVLLRLHEKYNFWNGPGGHIDPGEDVNEAALREVWEETGLTVELIGPDGWRETTVDNNRDLVPPLFMNRHSINEHHDHSSLIFAARSHTRDVSAQMREEEAECLWVTQAELDDMLKNDKRLHPSVHRYASEALRLAQN